MSRNEKEEGRNENAADAGPIAEGERPVRARGTGPTAEELHLSPSATLAEARAALANGLRSDAGVICPCCEQQATIYYRRVNLSIVKVLWVLAQHHWDKKGAWAHIPTLFKSSATGLAGSTASQGGQWAQAEKWGLVERDRGNHREDGSNRTGFARITPRGLAFLAGKYKIREHALFYNNTLLGKAGDLMGINDVRGFDYQEIFGGAKVDASEFPDEDLYVNKEHFVDVSSLVQGEAKSPKSPA